MAGSRARQASPNTGKPRSTKTPPGDATGKERDRLQEENAEALQKRNDITTISNPPAEAMSDTIIDVDGGGVRELTGDDIERLRSEGVDIEDLSGGSDDPSEYTPEELAALSDGTTDVDPETPHPEQMRTLDEPPATGQPHTQPGHTEPSGTASSFRGTKGAAGQPDATRGTGTAVLDRPTSKKVMRVNELLEDVTIGKDPVSGNLRNFTFKPNQRYYVDAHIYEHLDRLGYVYH